MISQERGIADPQTTEKILAIGMAYDEGENNNDPAAIAALFTEDAVMVTRGGPVRVLFSSSNRMENN